MTRIKDIATTATEAASDDYIALDGTTEASRKILASNLSGGFAHIASNTFSTASTVNIALPDTYESFRLEYYAALSTSLDPGFRITTDNFSTVKSGGSDYEYVTTRYSGSFGGARSSGSSQILTIGANGSGPVQAIVDIISAKDTNANTRIFFTTNYVSGGPATAIGYGNYLATTNVDGIQLYPSTGTITGGYRLWGIKA